MTRYLVERAYDPCTEEELDANALRSKRLLTDVFTDVSWEHSHVCADDDGNVRSFCVYDAPSVARVRASGMRDLRAMDRCGDSDGTITRKWYRPGS